jgi:hypothetical protein
MNSADIALYVDRQLAGSYLYASLELLKEQIVVKSRGVFLWTVIIVFKVRKLADKGLPFEKIHSVIKELPSQLYELYTAIFATLDPALAEDTFHLICWVLFAARPLDTDELRIGLEFMKAEYPRSLQIFAFLPEQVSYFGLFVTEISGGLFEVVDTGIPSGQKSEGVTNRDEQYGIKTKIIQRWEGARHRRESHLEGGDHGKD